MRQSTQPDTYGLHLTLRLEGFDQPAAREDGPPEKAGCSGVVILYESHAAIHTYPHQAAAFVDVFSCRQFATAQVTDTLAAYFESDQVVEQRLAERGLHWSADAHEEMLAWRSGR